jgi:hypothetical protein
MNYVEKLIYLSEMDSSLNQSTPKTWTRLELEKNRTKKMVSQNIHKILKFWKKHIYSCASIWIQTIIHKYENFLMYIASKGTYNQNNTECNPYLNQNTSTKRL